MNQMEQTVGRLVALWRYPVKSMMGEELNATEVTAGGLLGDRAYALVDRSTGKVVSAKNPRKWPTMFGFRAALAGAPGAGGEPPPVRVTLPDGTVVTSDQAGVDDVLSRALQREVRLAARRDAGAGTAEEYWPDIEERERRDAVTDFGLPEGTFFDAAPAHLLTTATLDRLRALYPEGRFETRRFRPNLVVETETGEPGFVENGWAGHVVAIGDSVRLSISGPCPRCVMTTLAQGDLPPDTGILRTAARHNQGMVGVYASVLQAGTVRRGDMVRLLRAD